MRGDTLYVVNWNIEYFGDPAHHNPGVQAAGVRAMMNAMDADIYAICEVVDVDSFAAVVSSLNGNYGYEVSAFGSFAASPASTGYASAQKLAFVYRRSLVRRVSARALLASSSAAYSNFSSGRFPYQVDAEVLGRDSVWRPVTFIVLHAKAYADNTSCARRTAGCRELKDTLDRYMPATRFLLLGDFNDDLDVSNCASSTESNYAYMVNDSAHYKSVTLPISRAGAFSTDGYSSLIDHVIASDEMYRYYVPGSAEVLRSLAKSVDPDYDYDISDHFPVRTQYVLDDKMNTGISESAASVLNIYPNPASSVLHITDAGRHWKGYALYDMQGRELARGSLSLKSSLNVHALAAGNYVLCVHDADGITVVKRITVIH